jgi:trimethylamine--corrinoid protein Co-methyltransferase
MMAEINRVQPRLTVLSTGQIEQIHESSLKILGSTGVRVDSAHARQLFAAALGASAVVEDRVHISPELVSWAIEAAPAFVDVYDRKGQPAFRLGEGRARFGIGVTCLYYQDPATDQVTPFSREHMADMVRLGDSLPYYDVISTVGIIQDVPVDQADLYAALEMAANTTKPLVILVSDEPSFPRVLDLLEHVGGELAGKPWVIPYFNPVTPLVINSGTVDKMRAAIERGLPFIYSNYSMAGMSTPITAGGTLAVLHAELLAGLALSQLIKEGAPTVLGMLPAYFDMQTMVNFYDPQSILVNLACAEMMAHFGLPHCGTSGSGTGWTTDLLAAETYWMNHLTACMNKVGLAPFVGDNLGSKAFSPLNVVYVHEVIDQAVRFSDGFAFDDAVVDLKEIDQVGPAGSFLMAKTTLSQYRQAYYPSPIFPRLSLEKWQAQGRPQAIDFLREYTRELLGTVRPPLDHEDLLTRGEIFIRGVM